MIEPVSLVVSSAPSVAGVRDLNHDGIEDILIGVSLHSNFGADHINCDEAFVFSGAVRI